MSSLAATVLFGCVLAELLFVAHCWPLLLSLPAVSKSCSVSLLWVLQFRDSREAPKRICSSR